jgi:prepilin peptidase CpaA
VACLIADVVLVAVLAVAVATDLARGKIYNWLTVPAAAGGLAYWTVAGALGAVPQAAGGGWGAMSGFLFALFGLLALFVPMMLVFALGGIGGGDAKLAGAIGALAGWRLAVSAMFYGFIAAAVVALIVMIGRRVTRQTAGRVWRFIWLLAMGVRPGTPTDHRSPRIATALPWAIGTIWAIVQQQFGVWGL